MAATKTAGKKKTAKKAAPKKAAPKKPAAKATGKKSMAEAEDASMVFLTGDGRKKKNAGGADAHLLLKQIGLAKHNGKPFNPRTACGDISSLATSMKKNDLIHAVVVAPGEKAGQYDIVAGERRFRAAQTLGWSSIRALIRADLAFSDDEDKSETMLRRRAVAVAENSEDGRMNLNAIELGRVFKEQQDAGWSISRIAGENGVHTRKVRRCLDLANAPSDVQKQVETGELSMIAGLEVAKLDDATRKKIKASLTDGISAAQVKQLAKKAAKEDGATATDGKSAQKKKGKERAGAMYTWKGNREKQAMLRQFAYYYASADDDQTDRPAYYEMRGALAVLLWDRGDLENAYLPSADPDNDPDEENPAAAKKFNKIFTKIVKAEAAKFDPSEDEEEEEEEESA